jgi:hypothetical protein
MNVTMKVQNTPPPRPSRKLWEDNRWLNEHWSEIVRAYPNVWVAVVEQQVVASGGDPEEVAKTTQEKTGRLEFPLCFVEQGIYVY